jgi:hypothetical protein
VNIAVVRACLTHEISRLRPRKTTQRCRECRNAGSELVRIRQAWYCWGSKAGLGRTSAEVCVLLDGIGRCLGGVAHGSEETAAWTWRSAEHAWVECVLLAMFENVDNGEKEGSRVVVVSEAERRADDRSSFLEEILRCSRHLGRLSGGGSTKTGLAPWRWISRLKGLACASIFSGSWSWICLMWTDGCTVLPWMWLRDLVSSSLLLLSASRRAQLLRRGIRDDGSSALV